MRYAWQPSCPCTRTSRPSSTASWSPPGSRSTHKPKQARRWESIERRIARVDEAIALWGAWEASQQRPPDDGLPITPPELPLADCLDRRRMLVEELTRLG